MAASIIIPLVIAAAGAASTASTNSLNRRTNRFNMQQNQAALEARRAVLVDIMRANGLVDKFHLTDDMLKRMINMGHDQVGAQAPTSNTAAYLNLGSSLLGAYQANRQQSPAGSTYGEGTMPPDFNAGSDFSTLSSSRTPTPASGSRYMTPCFGGGSPDASGRCP